MKPTDHAAAIGRALEDARTAHGMSRARLGQAAAELIGRSPYDGSTIAKWEREGNLNVEQLVAVEQALGLEPGALLRLAGYLRSGGTQLADLATVVSADPLLDNHGRSAILTTYDALVSNRNRR